MLEGFGAEERGEHGAHQPAADGGEDPRAVSAGVALPAWVLGAGCWDQGQAGPTKAPVQQPGEAPMLLPSSPHRSSDMGLSKVPG